jgi:hypothetical protein
MFVDGALLGTRKQVPPALSDDFLEKTTFGSSWPGVYFSLDACIESGSTEWHMPMGFRRNCGDTICLGHVEAGSGRPSVHYGEGTQLAPPGIFLQQPLQSSGVDASIAIGTQPPPPPVLPPQISAHYSVEPPLAPAHQPETFEGGIDVAGIRTMFVTETPPRRSNRFRKGSGSLLAQQLAEHLNEIERSELKVKNTFIDSGMTRSPSLERLLSERRQVRSCPGSALPTPQGKYAGTKLSLNEAEQISSSRASTVDTSETPELVMEDTTEQDFYASSVRAMPSLQAAAWRSASGNAPAGNRHTGDQHFSKYTQTLLNRASMVAAQKQGRKARVLQLEHVLAFSEDESAGVESDDSFADNVVVGTSAVSGFSADTHLSKPPRLGSAELPSVGSLGHHMRRCRPCAFVLRMGCSNGTQCQFCHLCNAGEKKRRRKEKRALIGAARRLAMAETSTEQRLF